MTDLASARAFVFDAYGTLFDVHSAVARHAQKLGPEAARLSEIWRAKQLEYSWVLSLTGSYEPFWILTERALAYALARCSAVDPAVKPMLMAAYRTLEAYPEVPDALAGLRARGMRTGVLSNGDPGMLADAVASAGVPPRRRAVRRRRGRVQDGSPLLRARSGRTRAPSVGDRLRLLEPLGRRRRGCIRLPVRLGEPSRPA